MFMRNITLFLFWWSLFFSISTSSADNEINLDIDENGEYDALSDGLVIIRYLFGLTGDDLVSGILGSNSLVVEPIEIKSKLDSMRSHLDVDENGSVDALTDGLLILRYLFGLRGDSLVTQVIGTGAARNSSGSIEDYIKSIMPSITLIDGNRGSGVFSFRNSQVINGQTINVFCLLLILLLSFIGILTPGIYLLCFNLLSSTTKFISSEIPKKFNAVVAFAGAP